MISNGSNITVLLVEGRHSRHRIKFVDAPLRVLGCIEIRKFCFSKSILVSIVKSCLFALKCHNIDVIISCDVGVCGALWFIISKYVLQKRYVLRIGGNPFKGKIDSNTNGFSLLLKIKLSIINFLLKNVEQLVVVSENMKAELSFYVSSNCQIHIISQFINLPEELNYNHRNETSIEILTVTNFGFKGKSEALKLALKQFLADERVFTTNISWSICGAGHFMQDFQAAISQNILPKNVNIILHGYQSEISLFYRNADLFLYTSFIDALPNVVLEAMSFGLPVLVNLEMWTILDQSIRNRCYFFDLSNSVSLMDQLATIIDEPFSDIYIANRDFIRTNFSKREIGSKWHNLLNSVLNISS